MSIKYWPYKVEVSMFVAGANCIYYGLKSFVLIEVDDFCIAGRTSQKKATIFLFSVIGKSCNMHLPIRNIMIFTIDIMASDIANEPNKNLPPFFF
jgi:hypothetical protein